MGHKEDFYAVFRQLFLYPKKRFWINQGNLHVPNILNYWALYSSTMQDGAWDVTQSEEYGVRQSFSCWPSNRIEATRCVAPLGCLYTPLKDVNQHYMPQCALQYEPIYCTSCKAILNPYCQVDFMSKLWTCPFCLTRNHFPSHYAENINENNLPAELIPQYITCEYEPPPNPYGPAAGGTPAPAFLFVIDTCIHVEELAELTDSIQVRFIHLFIYHQFNT